MSEHVLDLARNADVGGLVAALRPLSVAERRKLAPAGVALLRHRLAELLGFQAPAVQAAQVLVIATATPAEVRRIGPGCLPPDALALSVLLERADFTADFLEAIASFPLTRWNSHFALLRALMRSARLPPPTHPGYILAMLGGLEGRDTSLAQALEADPGLLQHEVWQLFEIEGAGETSLAAHDKYTRPDRTWSHALLQLTAAGRLPRERLLDASLAALARDFAAFRAGWFARFHEALEPTIEERRQRLRGYLGLLPSPVAATVSFAVRALVRAGGVPDSALELLRPALSAHATATVKGAIGLLPRSSRGAALAAEAVAQAPREAQHELLTFLERLPELEPDTRRTLAAAAPHIAASLRERLARLQGPHSPDTPPRDAPLAPRDAPAPPRDAAAPPRDAAAPPRDASRVLPVASLDDLVSLLAAVLERSDDPLELERALDGVSRLCQRDAATLRRIQPVVRRATDLQRRSRARPFRGTSPRMDVAGLITAWSSGTPPPASAARVSVMLFCSERVREVAVRAAAGKPRPLLALPTKPGGAIDPGTLAERRAAHPGADELDALQAALRAGELRPSTEHVFGFTSQLKSHTAQGKTYTHVEFRVTVQPALTQEPQLRQIPELLAAAVSGHADYCNPGAASEADNADAVRWVATVWPANREPYYARGARAIGTDLDWWETHRYARHFLEPLLLPHEHVGSTARLLIMLGLASREAAERTLATDVLVSTIGDARLDVRECGEVLGRLYAGHVVKASRLAVSLGQAAQTSTQHAEAVSLIMQHTLAAQPPSGESPADLYSLLALLSDVLASTHQHVSLPAARDYLASLRGSSKAATTARALVR